MKSGKIGAFACGWLTTEARRHGEIVSGAGLQQLDFFEDTGASMLSHLAAK